MTSAPGDVTSILLTGAPSRVSSMIVPDFHAPAADGLGQPPEFAFVPYFHFLARRTGQGPAA